MGKIPKFFKLAFVEIIILVAVIIGIMATLFYLKVIPLPQNVTLRNPSSLLSKGSISASSQVKNYTLTIKGEKNLLDTLNAWDFFNKSYKTQDGKTHAIDAVTVILSTDKPVGIIKKTTLREVTAEIEEKVEGNTLILTFYMQEKDLDTPNIPNTIITGNVMTYITELINADKNTTADRQKMIQLINETTKNLAQKKSGFFIIKNK